MGLTFVLQRPGWYTSSDGRFEIERGHDTWILDDTETPYEWLRFGYGGRWERLASYFRTYTEAVQAAHARVGG